MPDAWCRVTAAVAAAAAVHDRAAAPVGVLGTLDRCRCALHQFTPVYYILVLKNSYEYTGISEYMPVSYYCR